MTHVVVIADSRFPIGEPFAGGLQAMTWHLVRGLTGRGVEVSVYAGGGSDPALEAHQLHVPPLELSDVARNDVSMPPLTWLEQHHSYLALMLELSRRDDVDVIHNNALHHLPVAMADGVSAAMVTTLHSPPTPWLESALQLSTRERSRFVAVSDYTARQWGRLADVDVVRNGIDTTAWPMGPGGDDLVWTGRIVPEKAPHLAIDIARAAGRRLRLAGPVGDPAYWREQVVPRLADRDDVEYVGHLRQSELATMVGSAAACLVTPVWDEPYGLVGAEALSCGTPVVGFARGGLPEVVDESSGRLVDGESVAAAVGVLDEAVRLPREDVRRRATSHCSVDLMIDRYLDLYAEMSIRAAA